MNTRTRRRLVTASILLGGLALLPVGASCGGSSSGIGIGILTLGIVRSPNGTVAHNGQEPKPGFFESLFGVQAYAAVSGLANVPDGTVVKLIEVDDAGAQVGDPIAETTTENGEYGFRVVPATNQVVIVEDSMGNVVMRGLVNGSTVDVDPVSEFVVQETLTAISNGSTTLDDVTLAERVAADVEARELDIDFGAGGFNSTDIADAVADLDASAEGAAITGVVTEVATAGSNASTLDGTYGVVGLTAIVGNFLSVSSFLTEERFDGEGVIAANSRTGTESFWELSGSTFDSLSTGTEGGADPAGSYTVRDNSTFTVTVDGSTTRGAVDNTGTKGEFGVFLDVEDESATLGARGFGLAVQRGSGLSNSTVSGTYNFVLIETLAASERIELFSSDGTMVFNGSGTISSFALDDQEAVLHFATPTITTAMGMADKTGSYSVGSTGSFSFDLSPDISTQQGYVSPGGDVIVTRFIVDDANESSRGILIACKQASTLQLADLNGSYNFFSWQMEIGASTGFAEFAAELGRGAASISSGAITGSIDGSGYRMEYMTSGPSTTASKQTFTNDPLNLTISGAMMNGQLAHDAGAGDGMALQDGSLIVLPNASGNPDIRGIVILVRQ